MLSYHLARRRHARHDAAGAAQAGDEVLEPRRYYPYRAIVLPDCLVWTAEAETDPARARALYRRLVDAWTGPLSIGAVETARSRLAASRPRVRAWRG